ncbi:MAG TPA: hypothetical protein VG204_18695 [Terriglobia bacterium]|nr:hypothetical protein [Terriglobia bacterium]
MLVDLTLGNGAMEVWTATPTPAFLVKHQITFRVDGDDRLHTERAIRDLALADALFPGWFGKTAGEPH